MSPLLGSPLVLASPADRLQWWLLVAIRLSLLAAIAWAGVAGDWENLGLSVLALAATYLPGVLERRYRVRFPVEFHAVIVLFLYISLFLGEVGDAYERFWWWDMMLHSSSGVVLGFGGFLVLYTLQAQQKLRMSPRLVGFFSFCVALAGGALWEIAEYLVDVLFGANMQRGSLPNTMRDLIVDGLGALAFVGVAMAYLRRPGRGLLARLVENFQKLNPQLFGMPDSKGRRTKQ